MTSKEALYLLMANQKKVRDGFTFIDLNTQEKVSIEDCYVIVIKDLDRLEELEKENKLLKKDLKEYQAYIKKGVEEHYKDFMQDYDVLLEEYEQLMNAHEKLLKEGE